MMNIGFEGVMISQDISTRLVAIQADIDTRKLTLFKRYLSLLSHIGLHDKSITKDHLIEFRNYLGSELIQLGETKLQDLAKSVTAGFGLDAGALSPEMESIRFQVLAKTRGLMKMESIGFPDSTGAMSPVASLESLSMPKFLEKRGIRLPVEQKWTDIYALIEIVGLLIVQKDLMAEKMILSYQAVITGRQSRVMDVE